MNTPMTIAPVEIGAEFCDLEGLRARFGIKRSLAYQLLGDKKIRAVTLRRKGRARGKRLIEIASVRAYLNKCPRQ